MRAILFNLLIIHMHSHNHASKDVLIKTHNGKSYLAKTGATKNETKEFKSLSEHNTKTGFVNNIYVLDLDKYK